MAPSSKASPAAASLPKSKKSSKSLIVTLKLSPKSLVNFDHDSKASSVKAESTPASTSANTAAPSPGENGVESSANTPVPVEDVTTMPPPAEGTKKNGKGGVKRSLPQGDGLLKPRGKPGPKKKIKLEDGSVDPTANGKGAAAGAGPKLGPKANQGAINAGLRALDRSGKPCRKWQKGSFHVKSFTGTSWEIPRWRAPPRSTFNGMSGESPSESSSKENKESIQLDSDKSNSAGDMEMHSIASASIDASSPAPVVAASA